MKLEQYHIPFRSEQTFTRLGCGPTWDFCLLTPSKVPFPSRESGFSHAKDGESYESDKNQGKNLSTGFPPQFAEFDHLGTAVEIVKTAATMSWRADLRT